MSAVFKAPQMTASRAGSVMVFALMTFVIISLVVATVVIKAMSSYRVISQAAPWQEALLGAESGSDLAMAALRNTLRSPATAWTGWQTTDAEGNPLPNNGRTFKPPTLTHTAEGNTEVDVRVTVDAPAQLIDSRGRQWYRIRSIGTTYLANAARIGADRRDQRLRRFSFVRDPRTGTAVDRPQTSRMVEVIARPTSFENAIIAQGLVEMNNWQIVVDSFDSRDPAKSTDRVYDVNKRQHRGDVATNGQIIQAGNAHIYGDVYTNAGVVTGAKNITGEQRTDFYQELLPVQRPGWTLVNPSPGTINSSLTLTAGSSSNPTRYKVSSISLSGGDQLVLAPPTPNGKAFVEVWVTGNISTSGNSQIVVQPGVTAKIYVEGNVGISGNGFVNQTTEAVNLQVFGVTPPDGSSRSIAISGNGSFIGAIYAPGHGVTLNGGGSSGTYFGAVIAKVISMNGHTAIHYDEALGDDGFISDYKVASWFEDLR